MNNSMLRILYFFIVILLSSAAFAQTTTIRPSYLHTGDSVAVISISSEIEEDVKTVIDKINVLEDWGFKVKIGKHLFDTDDGWFSGSDVDRKSVV